MNRIGILGAGSGGLALGSYLSDKNHKVSIWNRNKNRIDQITKNNGNVLVHDHCSNKKSYKRIGNFELDLKKIVERSKYIFIVMPAIAYKEMAQRMASYITDEHIIILMPGRTFGTVEFMDEIKKIKDVNPTCIETQTIIHTCRFDHEILNIYATKPKVQYTSLRPLSEGIIREINELCSNFVYEKDYLAITLHNIGAMLHPIPAVLNITQIENSRKYKHYIEGITPVVANYIEKIDLERKEIYMYLGKNFFSVCDWLSLEYGSVGNTLYEKIQNTKAYDDIYGANSLKHRYIYDDLITGLVPIYWFGKSLGLKLYNLESFITFACNLLNYDFYKNGRNYTIHNMKAFSIFL
ncbi:NAD/NADP octopine/nopaline dehydrogenase family protein [Crassaminicella profunda]|uniref:NAD/NADP octopine/nopaline dehydrogenase family protein n=1 Tax=Crassaminicella profunda TaxID=1286698 RepID=UPI001CA67CAC|nr:NAD/NADP octopine/nopaline dehydrogenase family protein [Crassaminicella profunda]QZY56317.1 NAD/NADP octopine/nopaline dehydrogenase family protein [Crassaminicella profunda]